MTLKLLAGKLQLIMSLNDPVDDRPTKRVKRSPGPDAEQTVPEAEPVHDTSASQMDHVTEKEGKVGITAFVNGPRSVIHGIVKIRYTDFLVNEILPGGQVLHLRKTKADKEIAPAENQLNGKSDVASIGKADQTNNAKPERPTSTETASNAIDALKDASVGDHTMQSIPQIPTEDKSKLISHLNETAVTELLALYESILTHPKRKAKDHPIVKTEFTSDRTLRAHIHQDIRRIFNSKIESSTTHDGILILQAAVPRNPNHDRFNKQKPNKLSWQEKGGEYCHFTLYKENKDTMEAISLLVRFLKMNTKEFGFAGTKDRRAVTVQRCSVRRVDAERLGMLNRTLRMCAVGDFDYAEREVGLGELEGNEFTITLRNCDIDGGEPSVDEKMRRIQDTLTRGMGDLATKGFLNYFGLQRFGTFAIRSDVVGLKLLSGDFEGTCNAILEYSPTALEQNIDGDEAYTSNVGREDRARAEAIKHFRETGRVNESLNIMPKRFSAESAIIRQLGRNQKDYLGAILSVQHGMRTMYVHAYQSMVWNKAVSERWRLYGDKVVEGDLVLVREHRDNAAETAEEAVDADGEVIIQASGENRAKMADEVFERARALSKEEAESGQYGIFDVVLPQPGYDVLYPKNESGEFYKMFMGSEEGGGLDPNDMRRKQREFSLPGAYRKIVARIGGEWSVDVRRYEKDEEQFVETDLERISRERQGGGSGGISTPNGEQGTGEKIAAVLKFQLGTSQYATMALRELSSGGVREYKPEFSGGR